MQERMLSVDFFRGLTVAGMIIVNNPGSWDSVYPPLLHARWNGCTPTDLIFPFFLFIVGLSIHLAYRSKKTAGLTRALTGKILKRSAIIFILGIFLAWYALPPGRMIDLERLSTLRIPGVLQRISIVFLCCSLIYFKTGWVSQIRIASILLLSYYILMVWIPVPDFGAPNLEPGTNLAAWFDRLILGNHLWAQAQTWDPEGILSTIPAVATGMLGMLTGQLMDEIKNPAERVSWIFLAGGLLIVAGLIWDLAFPINKSLWTSSYVLYTGGLAMQVFASSHLIIDVHQRQSWTKPFLFFGTNAIFAFVISGILARTLLQIKLEDGSGESVSVWKYLFQHGYAQWMSPNMASLFFAGTFLLVLILLMGWMYSRKIFIKV